MQKNTRPKTNLMQKVFALIILALMVWAFSDGFKTNAPPTKGNTTIGIVSPSDGEADQTINVPDEQGIYTSKEDVALYIHVFGKLPGNFITKKEARALGWQGGDLRPFIKNTCIGGDRFGNYDRQLPTQKGRIYYECDIDSLEKPSRGPKRIVFSNDGLIYYTKDHYESFELLYGEKQ